MTDAFEPEFRIPSVDYFSLDASYEFSSGPLDGLRFDARCREPDGRGSADPRDAPRPTPTRRNTTSSAAATT